ncbi:unnamed protein product [Brachionus calyciflorus]|uniref:G-protein coupled receptors family 1 profile domain-containing protein n=1 Tax=Brachionus calyciflorus TaxID=104777 RepID=A0A813TRG2_9BILA|nr:unnamed protein product [Brachionus calyciflorus]
MKISLLSNKKLIICLVLNFEIIYQIFAKHSNEIKISNEYLNEIYDPKDINNICNACICKYFNSIDCFFEQENHILIKYWINRVLNQSHFEKFHSKLKNLFMDSSNINFKLENSTFSMMKNLLYLTLDNFQDLTFMPNLDSSHSLKELTIQNSNLKIIDKAFCSNKKKLSKIDMSLNDLVNLEYVFDNCSNLALLDLSYNQIKSLNKVFNQNLNLINLNLKNNLLTEIGELDLFYLVKLSELSLANNQLKYIHENAFDRLENLVTLDLSKNSLYSIPLQSQVYNNIEILSIYENPNLFYFPKSELFYSIKKLNLHYSYHCCPFLNYKPKPKLIKISNQDQFTDEFIKLKMNKHQILTAVELDHREPIQSLTEISKIKSNFSCLPKPDPFTPCENLLEDLWLRIGVWLVSVLGILSNFCVIGYNFIFGFKFYKSYNEHSVPNFLLTNLASADSLMSIYLLFIALKDASSRHHFGQSALEWQSSFSCNLAGFLSVISSLSSALCLCFITYERFYAIKNSINSKRLSLKFSIASIFLIWVFSFFVASLPLFKINTYSAYAICLPFETKKTSHKIYIMLLNGLLSSSFFIICFLYASIFIKTIVLERRSSFTSCNSGSQIKLRLAEDQKLARNIFLLVIVNIFCWGPVVILGAYSVVTQLPINREYLKILVVFVIPFNSLLNPYLYCISRRNFRFYIRKIMDKYGVKNNKKISLLYNIKN